MRRLIKSITLVTIMITMLIGATAAVHGATDPLDAKLSTYSLKENQAIFDYLQKVYTEKSPGLALETMYLSPSDESKVKRLGTKIVGAATSNSAKFNKIVEWAEANIEYESEAEAFPMDVIYHGKANCWGYAQIISAIARSQNIPCVPVSGFRGDVSWFTYNNVTEQVGHAWVYAYFGGKWRLYDPLFNVYNKTDLSFISKWYKPMMVEGVWPVYKNQNLKRANAFANVLYINGKFMSYTDGKPSSQYYGNGAESFSNVNEFCYPIRPYFNGTAIGWGDIFTGWTGYDYIDEPYNEKLGMSLKKSKMINDECFIGAWTGNIQTKEPQFYMRQNGICMANSVKSYKGNPYFLAFDGTAIQLTSSNISLYNGYPMVTAGESIQIYAPVWKDWQGYENDDGTTSKWHIKDDTPAIAHMNDNGVVTGKKPGIATFYINCNYDNIAVQVRVVDKKPTIKLKSKVKATLSEKIFTYNGKAKNLNITIKNNRDKVIKKGDDYTVTFPSGRTDVGTHKAVLKGKGIYNFTKTLSFKIKPVKTRISSLTAGTKSFTVKWDKKTAQVTGYEIQYSTSGKFKGTSTKKVTVKSNKITKKTIKGLKANKKYYVRVRTYKTVKGTKYYSDWTKGKTITTK